MPQNVDIYFISCLYNAMHSVFDYLTFPQCILVFISKTGSTFFHSIQNMQPFLLILPSSNIHTGLYITILKQIDDFGHSTLVSYPDNTYLELYHCFLSLPKTGLSSC